MATAGDRIVHGDLVVNNGVVKPRDFVLDASPAGYGAVPSAIAATVSAAEYGDSVIHKTVITMTAAALTFADDHANGQWATLKLYDMPAGNIALLGAVIDADLTLITAAFADTSAGFIALGSTGISDASAMTTTDVAFCPTTAIAAMVAQVGPCNAATTAPSTVLGAGTTDLDVYLNITITEDAAATAGTGTITGTVTLSWVHLGDY